MNRKPPIPDAILHAHPLPWSYNPSSWQQRVPICLLALVAAGIAGYLALYQWRLISSAWDPLFGDQTEKVLDSAVAQTMHRWFRIPDAAFGALAYLGDAVFGLAGSTRRWQDRPWVVILFGIDVIPLGIVSAILVGLQATVVGHWCFLCLATAAISLILVYWAYDEVWTCLKYLRRVWQESRSWTVLGKTFVGRPTPIGVRIGEEFVASAAKRRPRPHQRLWRKVGSLPA